jgi:hypothetical protein
MKEYKIIYRENGLIDAKEKNVTTDNIRNYVENFQLFNKVTILEVI